MTELRAIALRAADHVPHRLHGTDRVWPETNCYLDLWIELLSALGRDPLPLLGLAVSLDWEADHFTFLKPSAADIFALTGVAMHEMAVWDETGRHVAAQLAQGSVPLLEVDAFYLPDTPGAAYRERHSKTTIAVVAMDEANGWIEYFHNAGLFRLDGDNYAGVLGCGPHRPALFPYAEVARPMRRPQTPEAARRSARTMLARLSAMRRPGNPVARFAEALPALIARTGSDPVRIHALCFNTTRQLGAAFGLFAEHLAWLGEDATEAAQLADIAKALQFQITRAARRGRTDPAVTETLHEAAAVWLRCVTRASRLGQNGR